MGFGALLLSLNGNVPRLFIGHELGEQDLGIFAALAYFQVAGTTVIRAMTYSASPRLAKAYANPGQKGFVGLLIKLVIFGGLIGLAGIGISAIAGKPIVRIFYGPEYAEWSGLLVLVMVASMMHYMAMFLECGLVVIRFFRSVMVLLVLVVSSTTVSCMFMVPSFGMVGGVLSVAIGATIHVVGAMMVLIFALGFRKHRKKLKIFSNTRNRFSYMAGKK
jgi:O-antigen/teichoic acid export membrane protein